MMLYNSGPSISSLSIYLFYRFLFLIPPMPFQSPKCRKAVFLALIILYTFSLQDPITTNAICMQMTPKLHGVGSAILPISRSTFPTTYWSSPHSDCTSICHTIIQNCSHLLRKHFLLLIFASLLRLKSLFLFSFPY